MVVFHHIIKTGGMAVIANIAHCNPQLNILKRDAPFLTDSREPYPEDCCDFLHGHFGYEKIPPSYFIPDMFAPDYGKPYDFIGITERMNESIVKLSRLIKTDASKMSVVNASNSGPINYRLRELNDFFGREIETYNKVCAGGQP
jgi:hypothetical protein